MSYKYENVKVKTDGQILEPETLRCVSVCLHACVYVWLPCCLAHSS